VVNVDSQAIEAALAAAERALAAGRGLKRTGFWRVVDAARRDRALADRYAERIAAIDRRAFESGVKMRVPIGVGLIGLLITTMSGFGLVALAIRHGSLPSVPGGIDDPVVLFEWEPRWFVPFLFLAGTVALIVGTHSLAHWVVGRLVRMRFTHVFLGGPKPPRPGVKTDYATYLRATPMQRAVMHASGAVVTKVVPFALIPAALSLSAWPWLAWLLVAIGVVQIVTDVVLSTKLSDWKKVKRELT
jgi:hypothetical protein